jgi:hypothetical protein
MQRGFSVAKQAPSSVVVTAYAATAARRLLSFAFTFFDPKPEGSAESSRVKITSFKARRSYFAPIM